MNTFTRTQFGETGRESFVNLFVCCLVDSEWQAINIVDRFRSAGFSSADFSVLVPSRASSDPISPDSDNVVVSVLDSAFDWLGGLTVFHLPSVGLFHGAGPILNAFTGWNRAYIDDISAPLRTFGISQNRAQYYAERLEAGEILLAFHSSELHRAKRAEQIFSRMGAKDIGYSGSLVVLPPPEEAMEAVAFSRR